MCGECRAIADSESVRVNGAPHKWADWADAEIALWRKAHC
jgi:hypothetical protein